MTRRGSMQQKAFLVVCVFVCPLLVRSGSDDDLAVEWEDFKIQFGRNYSEAEDGARMMIFAQTLARIRAANEEPSYTFRAGINGFSDRTGDELSAVLGGAPFVPNLHQPTNEASGEDSARLSIVTREPNGAKPTPPVFLPTMARFTTTKTTKTTSKLTTTSTKTTTTRTTTTTKKMPQLAVPTTPRKSPPVSTAMPTLPCTGCNGIPDEWDWTTNVPPVVAPARVQGSCGSCWAFATAAALEGAFALKTGNLRVFSPQQFIDCSASNGNCTGGNSFNALNDFRNWGSEYDVHYPYSGVASTCRLNTAYAASDLGNYKIFPNVLQVDETRLKSHLVSVGPIVVDFYTDTLFYSYSGGVYNVPCPSSVPVSPMGVNHEVLLVGYGKDPGGNKYWKAKNSWGPTWGENGFFRIKITSPNLCNFGGTAYWPTLY